MNTKKILYTALISLSSLSIFAAAPHETGCMIIERHVSSEGPSRPQALKPYERGETHYSDHSYAFQSERPSMEDAFQELRSDDMQLYGVYDGHSGQKTVTKVGAELLPLVYTKIKNGSDSRSALTQSFEEMQATVLVDQNLDGYSDGTTAVVALVCEARITIANAGDSRAIIARYPTENPQLAHVVLQTIDHKPDPSLPAGPDGINEHQRLTDLGKERYLSNLTSSWARGPWRINGLAVSRAIGDKDHSEHGVIATPEIYEYEIPEHDKCTCMILACDGVWDVIKSQSAAIIVATALAAGRNGSEAAQSLVEAAYQGGSTDNITAMVVKL